MQGGFQRSKTLLIHADDFGLTDGVNRGIRQALAFGTVASTSVMMCLPESLQHLGRHCVELEGRAGVHLQLTEGIPCAPATEVPSLVDAKGAFRNDRKSLGRLQPDEVLKEWMAQVDAFLAMGLRPTHIDTHQHVHKEPAAFAAYCAIARLHGVQARSCSPAMSGALRSAGVSCCDGFAADWTGLSCNLEELVASAERAFATCGGGGSVELMCHPGYVDAALCERSSLIEARERELATLCNPQLEARLSERGIVLARSQP